MRERESSTFDHNESNEDGQRVREREAKSLTATSYKMHMDDNYVKEIL